MSETKLKKLAIVLFAIWYLLPIIFFSLWPIFSREPQPRFLSRYLHFLGLKQGFQLFAPMPIYKNSLVEATVTYKDGSQTIWRKPLSHADSVRALTDYRFRKLITYHLPKKGHELLTSELAHYLLWKYRHSASPVEKIEIYRFISKIPKPFERDGVLQYPNPGYKKYLLLECRAPFSNDTDFAPLIRPLPVTEEGSTIDSE